MEKLPVFGSKGFDMGLIFGVLIATDQDGLAAGLLLCLQGFLARLSQHEFHLGRDWPLAIGGRFACWESGSRSRKSSFPEM